MMVITDGRSEKGSAVVVQHDEVVADQKVGGKEGDEQSTRPSSPQDACSDKMSNKSSDMSTIPSTSLWCSSEATGVVSLDTTKEDHMKLKPVVEQVCQLPQHTAGAKGQIDRIAEEDTVVYAKTSSLEHGGREAPVVPPLKLMAVKAESKAKPHLQKDEPVGVIETTQWFGAKGGPVSAFGSYRAAEAPASALHLTVGDTNNLALSMAKSQMASLANDEKAPVEPKFKYNRGSRGHRKGAQHQASAAEKTARDVNGSEMPAPAPTVKLQGMRHQHPPYAMPSTEIAQATAITQTPGSQVSSPGCSPSISEWMNSTPLDEIHTPRFEDGEVFSQTVFPAAPEVGAGIQYPDQGVTMAAVPVLCAVALPVFMALTTDGKFLKPIAVCPDPAFSMGINCSVPELAAQMKLPHEDPFVQTGAVQTSKQSTTSLPFSFRCETTGNHFGPYASPELDKFHPLYYPPKEVEQFERFEKISNETGTWYLPESGSTRNKSDDRLKQPFQRLRMPADIIKPYGG